MPVNKLAFDYSLCGIGIDRDLNASKNRLATRISTLKLVDRNDIGLPDEARILGLKAN